MHLRSPKIQDVRILDERIYFVFEDDREVSLLLKEYPQLTEVTSHLQHAFKIRKDGLSVEWPDLSLTVFSRDLEPTHFHRTQKGFSVSVETRYLPLKELRFEKLKHYAHTNSKLPSPKHQINLLDAKGNPRIETEALLIFLELHPVLVREVRGSWEVIGGLRSFEIASLLPETHEVPVRILSRPSAQVREGLEVINHMIGPVLLQLGSNWIENIVRGWSHVKEHIGLQTLLPRLTSNGALAELLNVSPASITDKLTRINKKDSKP